MTTALKCGFSHRIADHTSRVVSTVLLFSLIAILCVARGDTKNIHWENVIGLWKRANDTAHALFLRKANGTFEGRVIFYNGFNVKDTFIRAEGHWSIKDDVYVIVFDYVSDITYRTSLHRPLAQKILHSNADTFSYVSTDGVDVVEHRINGASEAAFEKEKVEPFDHLKP